MAIPRLVWDLKEGTNIICASGENTENMPERQFSFELTRYKDSTTHRERLVIKCVRDGIDNGEAETTIDNLDKAFNELMQYGVVFSNDSELIKLKKAIKGNYLRIEEKTETASESKNTDEFLKAVGEYIQLSENDNTDDLCYIPVGIFDEIAGDCGYKSYELQGLRKSLKDQEYLHFTGDRIAILVRYQNKLTRVIAFKREKMQPKFVNPKFYANVKSQRAKKETAKEDTAK